MIKKVLLVVGVALIGFLGYVARQPSDYTISRELAINAPAEAIFPYINESQKMDSWSPWMELDPEAKVSFSGPEGGVGASTSWEGGKKLGTGKATVIESVPNSLVKTKLEYVKPYEMTQIADISLTETGNQTVVRWSVSGKNNFIGRIFCVFVNMDKMVGGTFEKGLNNLKIKIESMPAAV